MTSTDTDIRRAASLLKQNQLVAFPTETVYGLGGNALSDTAVAAIYAAKGRPQFNPLIVHVPSLQEATRYAGFNSMAERLARHFWPGPLTLVLRRTGNCPLSLLVSAGMETVALRAPAHPLAQALLTESGLPIAAPSANRSGRISPTEAAHVQSELGNRVAMILDGGGCQVGIESTVVDATGNQPVILRPGSVTPEQLANVTHMPVHFATEGDAILAPGMLSSHYAPDSPLRLNATTVNPHEALLAFGNNVPEGAIATENLSPSGNLQEAAANLFRMLRKLDAVGAQRIAVMPVPQAGAGNALGIAINDRLKRAATPPSGQGYK